MSGFSELVILGWSIKNGQIATLLFQVAPKNSRPQNYIPTFPFCSISLCFIGEGFKQETLVHILSDYTPTFLQKRSASEGNRNENLRWWGLGSNTIVLFQISLEFIIGHFGLMWSIIQLDFINREGSPTICLVNLEGFYWNGYILTAHTGKPTFGNGGKFNEAGLWICIYAFDETKFLSCLREDLHTLEFLGRLDLSRTDHAFTNGCFAGFSCCIKRAGQGQHGHAGDKNSYSLHFVSFFTDVLLNDDLFSATLPFYNLSQHWLLPIHNLFILL